MGNVSDYEIENTRNKVARKRGQLVFVNKNKDQNNLFNRNSRNQNQPEFI
jgi:hypothetical protein